MLLPSRRNLVAPIVLVPLGAVFALVCLLLILKKNDPRLVKRKLRIGALILTFTAFATPGMHASPSCYEAAAPDPIIEPLDCKAGGLGVEGYDGVTVLNPWSVVINEETATQILFSLDTAFATYVDLGYEVTARTGGTSHGEPIWEGTLIPVQADTNNSRKFLRIDMPEGVSAPAGYILRITGRPETSGESREIISEIYVTLTTKDNW